MLCSNPTLIKQVKSLEAMVLIFLGIVLYKNTTLIIIDVKTNKKQTSHVIKWPKLKTKFNIFHNISIFCFFN